MENLSKYQDNLSMVITSFIHLNVPRSSDNAKRNFIFVTVKA